MFDVITIGGASRDVFFMTKEAKVINNLERHQKLLAFEYGGKIIPDDSLFTYGGGGMNSAVSFVKLGLTVSTLLNIGHEGTGSLVIDTLYNLGVNIDHISRDIKNHTAMSIIVGLPGKDHTMFLFRGANDHLNVHDWRRLKTKWFYITSLTGKSADLIPEIFSYARVHGIKIAWNPGSEQLAGGYEDLSSYLEETDILILNRTEAESLAMSRDKFLPRDEKALLKCLNEITKGTVVITDGGNGSYATDGKKEYFVAASSHNAVETTGCGDAFGSTFVAMRILGYGTGYAMKAASYNAGSVVEKIGAQDGLLTFRDLSAKIELTKVEES